MILHLYFARRFLVSFFAVAGGFLAILMLVDMIEQLRRFEGLDVSFAQMMRIVLLNAPGAISEILPLIMILATLALFVALARSSELVVTRASGRSGLSALLAPIAMAALIGVLAVTTLNPIVAATSAQSERLSELYRTGDTSALSLSEEGLWLRQGSARGQTVIHAERYSADAGILYNVTFLAYEREGGPVRRIEAGSARLVDGAWSLRAVKVWTLRAGLNAEATAVEHESLQLPSSLTQERIRETLGNPRGISIWEMTATIQQLAQAGFSTKRHQVWLQSELSRPLFLMAMVLVAAAFTMRHTRSGGTGIAVLVSVLLGFGLYFIRNFAQVLGENGQLPILLAAWAPPVAALLLAFGLLLHTEDG
ncbi:LPS export ABC transporter permease LptG [Aestuariivita sp.]|jgi:lipopolysaccharide export system permease protein|uniref:LPS export ABC transporter permease LptG n=1 Tax=Aestuariivita sp. TaxID=1872407 RepID=UPI002173ED19|nr:LPS export ABC transporter permease LptG [Aestuariivita sp.]MCE8007809.1 LPS export ABC transporter permease LptG [Aestuariivita sp.]